MTKTRRRLPWLLVGLVLLPFAAPAPAQDAVPPATEEDRLLIGQPRSVYQARRAALLRRLREDLGPSAPSRPARAPSPLRARDREGREQTMDRFFLHDLGHHLGLAVHDVGSSTAPVPVGAVFTIEPGLYVPGEAIGIRIEDDYLMTDSGPVKLSRDIASDPGAIGRLMAEARGAGPAGAGRR